MTYEFAFSRWGVVAAVAACAMLSGCFGGSDDDVQPAVTSQVPGDASQSIGGFIAYLQALVVSDADLLEPVDTASVTPPTDDASEPVAIN